LATLEVSAAPVVVEGAHPDGLTKPPGEWFWVSEEGDNAVVTESAAVEVVPATTVVDDFMSTEE